VDMNWDVGELPAQGLNEHGGRLGLENAGHVLDAEDVSARCEVVCSTKKGMFEFTPRRTKKKEKEKKKEKTFHKGMGQCEVVLEIVFARVGAGNISGVADGGLHHGTGTTCGVNSKLKVWQVVERIEDAEDIHAVVLGDLAELEDDIVWVAGVAHGVGAPQEHLAWDVWNQLVQAAEAVPGTLLQETESHVKGGTTPVLQGKSGREDTSWVKTRETSVTNENGKKKNS